jgi:hypothetical protein
VVELPTDLSADVEANFSLRNNTLLGLLILGMKKARRMAWKGFFLYLCKLV